MMSIATIAAALAFFTPAPDTSSGVAVSRQPAVPPQPVAELPVSGEDVSLPDEIALPGDLLLAQAPESDAKYKTFDDAMRAGAAHLALKEISKSREPFEAALKLAPDDAARVRIYRALLPAYRQESDWLLGAGALEFIITHSNQPAERSVARTELMGFLHARGKGEAAVARYEERMKVNPQDEGTLYILMEVFTRLEPDPQRAAVLLEQWRDLKQKSGEEMKVPEAAQLAGQYVKQKKYREGAELFEATAPRDPKLAAWHFKEAAAAWLKAGDVERALAAANASAESQPESRGDLLEHFWHRGLADVFFECGDFQQAIPQYEQAIAKTQIDGYLKDCQARLAEAREKVDQ